MPAPISLAWAPGERLLASAGDQPSCNVEALPPLPNAFLSMFFAGHPIFTDRSTPLQDKSDRIRSIILSCRADLEANLEHENDKEKVKEMIKDLTHAHTVWHFIESVYLTDYVMDDRHTSVFLREWYEYNYPDTMEAVTQASHRLELERPLDDDDGLWDVVVKLATLGKLSDVARILSYGKQEDKEIDEDFPLAADERKDGVAAPLPGPADIVKMVYDVVERRPDDNIASRSDGSWEQWQKSCGVWADAEELDNHPAAQRLLGLLSGDTERIAHACTSWEQMLVACSLYVQYGIGSGGNLQGGHALVGNACGSASKAFEAPKDVAGGALLQAAIGSISKAIVCMEASLPSSWFSAHLCDLVVSAGKLEDKPTATWGTDDRSTGMREFYLKEFARELERYRGCWRIAVDYYSACPSHGTSLLIDLLSRVPLEGSSDPTVEKVLLVCTKRKLQRTARNICEKLGAECLSQQNLGGAMSWFARAGLYTRARGVAEQALKQAETEGPDSQAARSLECVVYALTNVGDDKMLETFDYIRVYCDMQQSLFSISSLDAAGHGVEVPKHVAKLISSARRLLGGGGLPRRYWAVVAFEVARVIELHPDLTYLFSRVDVSEILGALQLTSGPHRSEELTAGLRRRLAFEGASGEQHFRDEQSTVEDGDTAMRHCSSVFIRTAATRINAE